MDKFNIRKISTDRLNSINNSITHNLNAMVNQANQVIEKLKNVLELVSMYNKANQDYYNIISKYHYDQNYAGSLSQNVEPRYPTEQMGKDTQLVQELIQQIRTLESEIQFELNEAAKNQDFSNQTLAAISDSIATLMFYWEDQITQVELY